MSAPEIKTADDVQPVVGTAPGPLPEPEPKISAPVVTGSTILAVEGAWPVVRFDPSLEGCPIIDQTGTSVPNEFVDQAISLGAANGVSIVKR